MKKRILTTFFIAVLIAFAINTLGQSSTTSGMNGRIADDKNQPIPGATIVATHVPSGSTYAAIANSEGFFSLQGMRPGGPYSVEVSFLGYSKKTFTEIKLFLGETFILDANLTESTTDLNEVVVVGIKPSAFGTVKTGASTNINREDMALIPSLNRSLSDYTKLSPFSTGNGGYLGREGYMTNVTVDGANFNNNFGLSSNNMPGVSGEPISMEAIDEIQVAIAPYDVRQSNFTGAGINAITKSGTNAFKGSVYGFYRNQSFSGTKVGDTKLSVSNSAKKVYGFNVGGPIIKNKLFFFINAEKENTLTPGNTLLAMQDGRDPVADPNVNGRVTADTMALFSQLLKSRYGYETGRYESWGGDNEYNNKLLARIDWNITKDHKFSIRYNYSASSARSAPSNSGDAIPGISGGRQSQLGGLSFENSQYYNSSKLHSITAELNSRFGQISNKLLVAYTKYNQPRASDSKTFPFIDIMSGVSNSGVVKMSAGYELFSYKNNVDNNTLIINDDASYQVGNHNLTFGVSYENQYFANSYLRQGSGYYRFKDFNSFQRFANGDGVGRPYNDNYDPINFAYTYPINGYTDPAAKLKFGQFSTYIQDEYSVLSNLKVTGGVRVDVPVYLSGAVDNPALKDYSFRDGEAVDISTWPKTKILWSPRIGFTYDLFNDKRIKIRGGSGLFTGRIPFVWFTNQPTNSGMLQYQLVINQRDGAASQAQLARLPLYNNTSELLNDPTLADIFPQANAVGGKIAAIDKNFRLPQVWRSSLGVDIKLPLNMLLSVEGIYTKDENSIRFDNINLADAASTVLEGSSERPYWTNSTNATKFITQPYTNIVIMRNTNKGQGYSISTQLDLPKIMGFGGMIAYSRSWAEELTNKSGSDPFSAWQYRLVTGSSNSDELGLSANNTPHRIIGALNYSIEYLKICKTTISLFYSGYKGNAYSFIYGGDANGDGTSNDLMYIPRDASELLWQTPADADAYFAYAAQDPYLSKHAGEYAKRNAAYMPWNQRLDLRLMQEFKIKAGSTTNALQISLDIFNFANLLNSDWGLNKTPVGYNTNGYVSPLQVVGRDAATGMLRVRMQTIGSGANATYLSKSFQNPTSVAGTWGIQLGLKYIFN